MDYENFLALDPYGCDRETKKIILSKRIGELVAHHMDRCLEYRRMLEAVGFSESLADMVDGEHLDYSDVPFMPVRLFKELEFRSITQDEIVKTMTSSGTTGQIVSKIYLDKGTATNQQKVLAKIVSDFTGTARMPMLIIDCPSVIKDRRMFSARGAGILGFSIFGRDKAYVLRDGNMSLDEEAVRVFLEKHKGERILLFGFTFMIWQHFYKELERLKSQGVIFDLSDGILIHGGGWKKLASESVTSEEFRSRLKDVCGLSSVHDYYGMVEQTGCIYMECECGYLHASVFSDVLTRRYRDFSVCDFGEPGILQVVSSIPESYPGHSLLTEDEGVVIGEDDCPCGRKGKYFKVLGRLKNAEIRGCSDTYATRFH